MILTGAIGGNVKRQSYRRLTRQRRVESTQHYAESSLEEGACDGARLFEQGRNDGRGLRAYLSGAFMFAATQIASVYCVALERNMSRSIIPLLNMQTIRADV